MPFQRCVRLNVVFEVGPVLVQLYETAPGMGTGPTIVAGGLLRDRMEPPVFDGSRAT